MRRQADNQLYLDLDRGRPASPRTKASEELLQALADLLLEALGKQNKAVASEPEVCDAVEDHT
ncbi:hypothetical protein ABTM02_20430 [Acinetobacter baumannii]|jgi:hypothetical protein